MLLRRQLPYRALWKMPFYAVARGRQVGIVSSWPECQQQVNGYSGARYKKFDTEPAAIQYLMENQEPVMTTHWNRCAATVQNTSYGHASGHHNFSSASTSKPPVPRQPRRAIAIDPPSRYRDELSRVWYGEHYFLEDQYGYVHVYTDGSCEGNGQPNAAAGLGVYFDEDHPLNTAEPVSGRATNNCGEIQAATKAIQIAKEQDIQRLVINTDSRFLIDSITKWLQGWKRRNWTLANGGPVKNKIDFQQLDRELNSGCIEIKWNHVDAHRGILGNERADELARQGTEMYRAMRRRY